MKFNHITVNEGLSQNTIRGIVKDKYGFMWFGTWEGVSRYDGFNFKIFRANESDTNSLSNNRVNSIYKDSAENIWIVTGDQVINRYNYDTENFTRLSYNQVPEYIANGLSIRNSAIRNAQNNSFRWRVQNSGLLQVNKKTGTEFLYTSDPFQPTSLNENALTVLYLDNNGILWVGTENGGVNKADIYAKPFKTYAQTPFSDNTLVGNIIRAICEDKSGNIWVGTLNKGVTKIDIKNNRYLSYVQDPDNPNSLIDNNIRSIYADKAGNIWIGTKNGLSKYDAANNRFTNFAPGLNNTIPHKWVFWIMEDHNNHLWIGTFNGIAKYNPTSGSFYAYNPDSMLKSKNVRVILEDSKKRFWVATEGGGITLLKRDSTAGFTEKITPLKHFVFSPNDSNSINNNMVLTMTEDNTGMIWIGTNNGLCRLNPENFNIKRFNINTGLPDNLIMGVLNDQNGRIWISHKKGLSRLNIADFSIRTYTRQDGLPGNEFTQNAYYRSEGNGYLYFGGTNGMCSFHPDSISDNPFLPQVVLTSLKILNQTVPISQPLNGRIILHKSLLLTKEITLFYKDKTLAIEFAGLHFSNPMGNKYKYKLQGFDHDWIETDGNNRIASYSNLPAGNYVFQVMASNCDGLWNTAAAELKIHVLPPWWRSWWAYTLYIAIMVSILLFSYHYVVSKIHFRNQLEMERIKAQHLHELDQVKLEFFTHISHELRTPLSLIIDPLEKLSDNAIEPSKIAGYYSLMLRNAKRLLKLINQILDFRKLESAKLNLEIAHGDIIEFCRNIAEMFNLQAKQRNITYTFHSFSNSYFIYFDPDKLDKILFNLLSNAFKYTHDGGIVEVNIEKTNDEVETIELSVKDNGIGIPEKHLPHIFDPYFQVGDAKNSASDSTGIGLSLTQKLVELLHGHISAESEPDKGSLFKVTLPLGSLAQYFEDKTIVATPSKQIHFVEAQNFENRVAGSQVKKESSSPIILIVEDNPDVRNYLVNELNTLYLVEVAVNGMEGFSKALEIVPDLIISDVMMPEMSGIELCAKIKTDEKTSHIPIILLTARSSEGYKMEGYQTGADAYITKPFSTALLKVQINNLLESRKKLRELFGKGTMYDLKAMAINLTDEAFLNKIIDLIKQNIEEIEFGPENLASSLNMSLRQLYRKIKAHTDTTVHDFIISVKLSYACELLLSGNYTIAEVAYKTGFTEPANFTRSFTKKYGKNPTMFIQEFKKIQ